MSHHTPAYSTPAVALLISFLTIADGRFQNRRAGKRHEPLIEGSNTGNVGVSSHARPKSDLAILNHEMR